MIMTTTKSCRRGVLGTPPREKGADLEGVLEVAVVEVGHCQAWCLSATARRPSLVPIGDDDKNRVIYSQGGEGADARATTKFGVCRQRSIRGFEKLTQ
jgi:hypothetical protein